MDMGPIYTIASGSNVERFRAQLTDSRTIYEMRMVATYFSKGFRALQERQTNLKCSDRCRGKKLLRGRLPVTTDDS
jgi:hypothetical protein